MVGLGASLARPRLYSTGPIADLLLRDRVEEDRGAFGGAGGETLSNPFGPELHRMFEAQLPRMHAGLHCRLGHQEADQIVGEQVYPEFLLTHLRGLATQHFHAKSRLDVSQVELDVPSARVQLSQLSFACLARIEHGGYQHAACDLDLAHGQLLREGLVVLPTHPLRPRRGLWPADNVVASTEALAAAKVGDPRAILLEQYIYPEPLEPGDEEVVAVKGIGQEDIAGMEDMFELAIEPQLAASLARVRPHGRIEHGPGGQTHHPRQPHLREAHSLGLGGAGLVLPGVRHGNPGPIAELHRPASPAPTGARLPAKQVPGLARQRRDHLLRQPPARPTIPAGARTRGLEPFGHALGDPAIDGPLARAVFRERLLQEHGKCHRRRILPLAVLRQKRVGLLQQLGASERIEEIDRLEPLSLAPDARLMLLGMKSGTTISQGWPRGWFDGCVVTTSYQSQPAFPYTFQGLTVRCSRRLPLSKCHCS